MRLQPVKTYHPHRTGNNMDITPMLDTLYSQAECLVAKHGEICETAKQKIAEKSSTVAGALARSAAITQENHRHESTKLPARALTA